MVYIPKETSGETEVVDMMQAVRSELDQTIDVLTSMTDEELQAVRNVAIIIMNKKAVDRPFKQLTGEEFFAHVDEGIAELDAGLGEDSDKVDAEIAAEFGLAI